MNKIKIVIDPGHGGGDPGASGNGLVEADITAVLGEIVKQKLFGYDAEVLLTPGGTLAERAAFANRESADLFVSLHINAGGGTGYESHIHPGASEKTVAVAGAIHGIMATYYRGNGFADRGLKRSNFAVLRETTMPAVLLENLFIDRAEDAAFLRGNLPAIGNEIAWAIASTMELQPTTSVPSDPVDDTVKIVVAGQVLVGKDIEDRAWVPVRALAEALGHNIKWDGNTKTVTIL